MFHTIKYLFLLSTLSATLGHAGALSIIQEEEDRKNLGAKENCGNQPPRPGVISSLFSNSQKQAEASYYACLERNKRRDYLVEKGKLQEIVNKTSESCKNAIRRISTNPSTLSFDYQQDFSYGNGLNGSGVNTTDGGYSIILRGSDVRGSFAATCFMDKSYNITHII